MYFKIANIGEKKYSDMGMVAVIASFYLEEGDEGYDKYIKEHQVEVDGVLQLNPFCNHKIQFEADVTEEEILYCFEWALAGTHANYLKDDLKWEKKLGKVVNQPIMYTSRKAFYSGIKQIPVENQTVYEKVELQKCTIAEEKTTNLKEVDFTKTKIKSKIPYSIKG